MNSNQRSQGNNQSSNGGNEKYTSSSRSGVEETNLRQNRLSQESQHDASMQSAEPEDDPSWGREGEAQPTGAPSEQSDLSRSGMKGRGQEGMQGPGMPNQRVGSQTGTQQGSQQYEHGAARESSARDSTDRAGSQTGSQQNAGPGVHQSNDVAGGLPKSPGGKHLAADQKMDDDTGLSNTVNRQAAIDEGNKQTQQSNVGRRSDMTPD